MSKQTQYKKGKESLEKAEALNDEELDKVDGGYLKITMTNAKSTPGSNDGKLETDIDKKANVTVGPNGTGW